MNHMYLLICQYLNINLLIPSSCISIENYTDEKIRRNSKKHGYLSKNVGIEFSVVEGVTICKYNLAGT